MKKVGGKLSSWKPDPRDSSNIAEGHARFSDKEFAHFLSIVLGSLAELETQLMIAERLGYASTEHVAQLLVRADAIGKQVRNLQKTVKASS